MSKSEKHDCRCQTGERLAAVLFDGEERSLDQFEQVIASLAQAYYGELSIAVFEIGHASSFGCAPQLREFIETTWPEFAPRARACWLDPSRPIHRQFELLGTAQPLTRWTGQRESPLADILSEGRIETWFQPVFESERLELWGYECLARARDADDTLIAPADLFRWAREDNLLFMLDRVCRERHIENVATVEDRSGLSFLINFLPTVIYDPKVCLRTTFKTAERVGIDPGQVIFEVVESEEVTDHDVLSGILEEYRRAGFRVALDDLGSGNAGLTLLGDLSPDLIKIDRLLVSKSTTSAMHRNICQSVVDIARRSDKAVLAEGVETEAEYELFRRLGVDLFQGYLFGRPLLEPVRHALVEPLGGIDRQRKAA